MTWNWQQKDWPDFRYDAEALRALETDFLKQSGVILGAFQHLDGGDKDQLKVELISTEALKTSEIEGEFLNRDSLQSSIQRQLGLQSDNRRIPPAEQGIAEVMVDLYRNYDQPLSRESLCNWHRLLCGGRHDLSDIGQYRRHEDPMQVISGPVHRPHIHFKAPPSKQVPQEMKAFLKWFNHSQSLPALTRSGIAHLYFVCIHPFEDGNGRIGRALAEKSIAKSLGHPSLIALAFQIEKQRKAYYEALEAANKQNDISAWLLYFSNVLLKAQQTTLARIEFLIEKTKLYDRVRGQLNLRQEKVLARMLQAGPEGFTGGLKVENYLAITQTSRATATRDLTQLVDLAVLHKTGTLKGTRYHLLFSKG
jgi:Fic family protein